DDDALHLEGPTEDACRLGELPGGDEPLELGGHARPIRRSASFGARARASPGRRSNASPTSSMRSGSASSTENGPTSSRRNVRQWPPSAVAIARTYRPELTRRS